MSKKCDTCFFDNKTEYEKPCIIRKEDCEFYEPMRKMTAEEAIRKLSVVYLGKALVFKEACEMGIEAIKQQKRSKWVDYRDGAWMYAKCTSCLTVHDTKTRYCSSCGARMENIE